MSFGTDGTGLERMRLTPVGPEGHFMSEALCGVSMLASSFNAYCVPRLIHKAAGVIEAFRGRNVKN